jgi:ribonuclease G
VGEPRRDDRDRDRRGRRSRRRRGQKGGGRGLPDSKYFSLRPGGMPGSASAPPEAPDVPSEPSAVATTLTEEDEFFVLPGETLAKHTPQAGEEMESAEPSDPAVQPEEEPVKEEVEEEPVEDLYQEPVEMEAPAESLAEAAVEPVAIEAEGLDDPAPEGEFEEVEVGPADEPESVEMVEPPVEEAEPVEGAEPETIIEDEGPEPARIPTSLTATLREQGPRYLHRVSRRLRRKGRNGHPLPEGARAPQYEPRPQERTPEHRTAPGGLPGPGSTPPGAPAARPEKAPGPSISDLLKEGQEIIVQIAKEPLGQKGARITSHIALPGRFLVYMPTVDHMGVSRKIAGEDERTRLKRILQNNRSGISGGYIVRTAGEGRSEEELRADMLFLYNLWLDMRQKAERRPAPLLIHHDLNVVERILRDQLTSNFKSIWVDNEERFQPALVSRVKLYTRSNPIFDEFGITAEMEKALRPKVWLKSGGYIVINQTEALVAIDVNTGKFVGKSHRLEDTIVKTNTDAIKEIVRQIRLRDLGGIIVVDFIDMDERKNRQKVMQTLEEAMRADRAPYKILQFNDFGLVAITRKRVKQSLERTLCTPCPYCEGAGYVKSPQTVVGEILQEAHKIARSIEGKDVMLRVSPEVAKLLKSNQNTYLQELEEILGRAVIVKTDAQLHQEKFDLA